MRLKSTAALAAAAVFALATAASSATVVVDMTPDLSQYGLNGSFTNVAIVSGNSGGVFASPFGNGAQSYYTVGSPGYTASPAFLTLTALTNAFSLLWGSIDTYNKIEFYNGTSLVDFVTGIDVDATPTGSDTFGVDIATLLSFNIVKFYSNFGLETDQAAFEFATEAPAPVPVPAAGFLLLGALGGLAALRRRKAA